jgi:uncharacterized repeat protein (TIGR02543 family)
MSRKTALFSKKKLPYAEYNNKSGNMSTNFPHKPACGKIPSLILAVLVIFVVCACENPWMTEIMREKTITFNTNGGSSVPSQTLFKGESVTRPYDPYKAGFIFSGWYKDNTTFLEPYDFSFIPKQDMTLYAKWDNSGTEPPSTIPTFDNIESFTNWLNERPENNLNEPYTVELKISDPNDLQKIRDAMMSNSNPNKYLILDFSGSTINTIPNNAFSSNTSGQKTTTLIGIIIPDGVTSIGQNAFANCSNLTSVEFKGTINSTDFNNTAFSGLGDLREKYVANPGGGAGTYTRIGSGSGTDLYTWEKKE